MQRAIAFPYSPLAHTFGFTAPSPTLLATIVALAAAHLGLVDTTKRWFYHHLPEPSTPIAHPTTHMTGDVLNDERSGSPDGRDPHISAPRTSPLKPIEIGHIFWLGCQR